MIQSQRLYCLAGFLLLDSVASISLEQTLSILDQSIAEKEFPKCDLASFGGNAMLKEHHYGRAIIQYSIKNTRSINKDMFIHSKCVIMLCNENMPFIEVVNLGKKIQLIKPVGVLYEVKDWRNASRRLNTTTPLFPMVLQNEGKFKEKEKNYYN